MNQEQNIREVDDLLPPSQVVELVDHAILPAPVDARVQLNRTSRFATYIRDTQTSHKNKQKAH